MAEIDDNVLKTIGLSKSEFEQAILSKCDAADAELAGLTVPADWRMKGGGYLSAIFTLRLAWKGANVVELPDSVLVKAPSAATLGEGGGNDFVIDVSDHMPSAHRAECTAFERIGSAAADPPMPKVYYTRLCSDRDAGVILMEEIRHAVHFPPGVGATDAQVRALVECFAGWHAHIYSADGDGWKEGFALDTLNMGKVLDGAPSNLFPLLAKLGGERMVRALAMIPADSVVMSGAACAQWMADAPRRTGLPPVIVHGDIWSNNVFWRPDEHGEPTDRLAALIDWQWCRVGAPTEDMACLLSLSVSGEYRRRNEDALLHYYHERLCEHLSAKGKPAPFTYAQLKSGYAETLPMAVLFAAFAVPVLVKSGMVTEKRETGFLLDMIHDLIVDVFGGRSC